MAVAASPGVTAKFLPLPSYPSLSTPIPRHQRHGGKRRREYEEPSWWMGIERAILPGSGHDSLRRTLVLPKLAAMRSPRHTKSRQRLLSKPSVYFPAFRGYPETPLVTVPLPEQPRLVIRSSDKSCSVPTRPGVYGTAQHARPPAEWSPIADISAASRGNSGWKRANASTPILMSPRCPQPPWYVVSITLGRDVDDKGTNVSTR